MEEETPLWTKTWVDAVGMLACGHNFFITKGGIIGLGPEKIKVGDMVCILLGCSMPVIMPYR
jgi:hypothetical protein